jgi:hypothetical protein
MGRGRCWTPEKPGQLLDASDEAYHPVSDHRHLPANCSTQQIPACTNPPSSMPTQHAHISTCTYPSEGSDTRNIEGFEFGRNICLPTQATQSTRKHLLRVSRLRLETYRCVYPVRLPSFVRLAASHPVPQRLLIKICFAVLTHGPALAWLASCPSTLIAPGILLIYISGLEGQNRLRMTSSHFITR